MKLHLLDITVLLLYFAALFCMGLYFSKRNVDTERYFLGGRSFKGWVVGLSLVGTSPSSITFLASPGAAFKTAWLRYIPNLMLLIAVLIAAYVFLPFFRKGQTVTAYQYLEHRFGPSVRVYAATAFIIAQLVRVSMILYLISLVLQEITDFDATTCILISGTIVAVYTILGGIEAVIWTDVIQTIVLLLGGIVCVGIIASEIPGGLSQILAVASDQDKLSFAEMVDGTLRPVSWDLSFGSKTATMMLFIGLTNWLTEYSSNQNTVQRFCATESESEARKAMFICAACSLPIWAFFMFLGTALYVFFQLFPATQAAEILAGTRKAEEILPFFITHYLPAGLIGLVIAAALAAAMSSLDSSINAISTVSIVDIYRRHLAKDKSEQHYLRTAWIVATSSAVIMMAGAIYLIHADTKTLQDTATILVSLLGGGLLGIYAIGFLTDKGDARSVWLGIAGTMLFTAWTVLSSNQLVPAFLSVPFDLYYTGLMGNFLMFFLIYATSVLLVTSDRNLRGLTIWNSSDEQ
jgi:SSS family solute:Na+ symporter